MDNIVLVALASISSATATTGFTELLGAPGTGKLNLRKV